MKIRTLLFFSMVLVPAMAQARVPCRDVTHGNPEYHDNMDKLTQEAGLPDAYYSRYHEDVVGWICLGNQAEIKNSIDAGYVEAREVESLKRVLVMSEPIKAPRTYKSARRQFSDLGLCSACADNVAQHYVQTPNSRCGKLADKAVGGDAKSLAELVEFPSFCTWKY